MKKALISLLSLISISALCSCGKSSESSTIPSDSTITTSITTSTTEEVKKEHKITFMLDGVILGEVTFEEGTSSVVEPEIPEKEGYIGYYDEYTLRDTDIIVNAHYELKDLSVKSGGFIYQDGKYVAKSVNSLAVDKEVEFTDGTLSVMMHKNMGYEDSGIIFGLSYQGDELDEFFEKDGVSYYFFFVNHANFAYLAKSVNGVWYQLAGLGVVTEYNEETDFPLTVSKNGNYLDCYVGDKCLARAYDKDLEHAGTKVGYRAGGKNSSFTRLTVNNEPIDNPNDIEDFSVAHGSIEAVENGLRTTSQNTIALSKRQIATHDKLIKVNLKQGVAQDAGIAFGLKGGYRTFWEEGNTSFEYYFFFLNFNGTAILAHVNSQSETDIWKTLCDKSSLKDFDPNKEYELGVYVSGHDISCYINGAYVGGYSAMSDVGDDGYGVRAAQPGCVFQNLEVCDFNNDNPQWFLRAGSMSVSTNENGEQEITTNCDGTLATINNYAFEGQGGTISMDIKFAGGPRNGGLIFGGDRSDLVWGANYYIFETDWDNSTWIADGTSTNWLPVLGRPLSEVSDAWGENVANGWNEFHNYKIVWNGEGIAIGYINNVEVLKMNISKPTHTGNYFGFFSQGTGTTTIKNFQFTANK